MSFAQRRDRLGMAHRFLEGRDGPSDWLYRDWLRQAIADLTDESGQHVTDRTLATEQLADDILRTAA